MKNPRKVVVALALVAFPLAAQQPAPAGRAAPVVDIPRPKCPEAPTFPGRVGMQMEDRRQKFQRDLEEYKNCILAFVEERKAVMKANETAARSAIEDFNARIQKYNEEQEAARQQ